MLGQKPAGAPPSAYAGTGSAAGEWDIPPSRHRPAVGSSSSDTPSSSSEPPRPEYSSSKALLLATTAWETSYQGYAGASYSRHSAPPAPPSPPAPSANGYVQLLDDPDEIVPISDAGHAPGGAEARAIGAPGSDDKTGGSGDGPGSAIGGGFRAAAQFARDAGGEANKLSGQLNARGFKFAAGCLGLVGRGLETLGGKGVGDGLKKVAGDGVGEAIDDVFGIQDPDEDNGRPMSADEVRRKFRKEAMRRLLAVEHLRFGREGPLLKGFDLPNSAHAKLTALDAGYKDPYAAADNQVGPVLERINRSSDQVLERASQRLQAGMVRSRYLGEPATVRRDTAASEILDRASQRLETMLASKRLAYPQSRPRNPPPPPPPPLSFLEKSYRGLYERLTSIFPLAAKCLPEARSETPPVAAVEPKFLIGGGVGTAGARPQSTEEQEDNFLAKFGDGVEAMGKKLQGVGIAKGGAALEKAGAGIERIGGRLLGGSSGTKVAI